MNLHDILQNPNEHVRFAAYLDKLQQVADADEVSLVSRVLADPHQTMAQSAVLRDRAGRPPRRGRELDRALRKSVRRGGESVLIDGTLIPTQRRTGKANRPNYSGKHLPHGLHFFALTDEKGRLIWISAARPGRAHDATAARRDKIVEHLQAAGLGALADLGFLGVDKPDNPDNQGNRHRLQGHPRPQVHPWPEAGQPNPGRRTRPRRTRLRPSEVLARADQAPHRPRPRHRAPRPDQPRSPPVIDDQDRRPSPVTSVSTPASTRKLDRRLPESQIQRGTAPSRQR
jgi:hypothetical protein